MVDMRWGVGDETTDQQMTEFRDSRNNSRGPNSIYYGEPKAGSLWDRGYNRTETSQTILDEEDTEREVKKGYITDLDDEDKNHIIFERHIDRHELREDILSLSTKRHKSLSVPEVAKVSGIS